ncbi:kinase-like protein [Lojkania enalia]|uniref:Kinase-like protein n=1 Tax=Lojkania enalia TaxID=147567 RepID=A0A9P4N370_9PLEO|nr:kinase-like protein [Didymosphaeria enalia]
MSVSGESSAPLPANMILIEEGKDYLLEPGNELPYRLIRSLGHGHSGNVEEVEDRRRIFDNEIKIIRNLASHHHIIRIFATYVAKREVGLILQPVADDGDLDAFLDRFREDAEESEATDGRIIAHQAKIFILQRAFGCLASGLEFMHQLKVRHKDVKPRNILIHRGLVLYTDFGYSLDSSQSNHSTTAGRPDFLTRRYSAPEVLDHESRNSRSDIFSLGCVFIEMLSVLEMDLEIDQGLCFGEDIDRFHCELGKCKSKTSTGFLADLSEICVSMTYREPSSRFTASQVLAGIQRSPAYFCEQCQPAGDGIIDNGIRQAGRAYTQEISNSMSVVASSTALAPFDDHKLAGKLIDYRREEVPMSSWIWSSECQDFYYTTMDHSGQWIYHWYKQMPQPTPTVSVLSELASRILDDTNVLKRLDNNIVPKFGKKIASIILDIIPGTPGKGWYEPLDSNYRMRPGAEAYHFFQKGKVFAVLFTQTSTDLAGPGNDSITIVKYGEKTFSQVRRFVVVEERRTFVYACPISTYSGRGTLKPGVSPGEHSIVYFVGTKPVHLQGEYLTKDPIAIMPADVGQVMSTESRLCYAKVYPINRNVKAKDIGDVIPESLSKLMSYYRAEREL